jgi:8-oxo-dGTP pyrophosphatase MutT (NUDIX family)
MAGSYHAAMVMFSPPGTTATRPFDAATVILVRPAAGGSEVFLLRRQARSSFMASYWVFPGGRVDDADAAITRVDGLAALERVCGTTAERARAIGVAAVREMFEEAGVLLARRAGQPVTFADPEVAARFREHRRALWDGKLGFGELCDREDLTLSLGDLHYWSRWITPSAEPKRFDARFFVAELPAGQVPLHDQRETVAEQWLDPRQLGPAQDDGRVRLAPPTLRTLDELAPLPDHAALVAASRARADAPAPVMPRVHMEDGKIALLLPWDREYDAAQGEATPLGAGHPLAVGASRFVLENDRWVMR